MASTKRALWETDELRKVRQEYEAIHQKRLGLQQELGSVNGFFTTDMGILKRRSELKRRLAVVQETQSTLKETLQRESDRAFSNQVKFASTRIEALECLHKVLMKYLSYEKRANGPVDKIKLDQYWAAVVLTADEVTRFNKGEDEVNHQSEA